MPLKMENLLDIESSLIYLSKTEVIKHGICYRFVINFLLSYRVPRNVIYGSFEAPHNIQDSSKSIYQT